MGIKWTCDHTGREVFLNPPSEPLFDSDGAVEESHYKTMSPTGELLKIPTAKVKYLKEKGYLVRLNVGNDDIQVCLSEEGLAAIKPELKKLWDALEGILKK